MQTADCQKHDDHDDEVNTNVHTKIVINEHTPFNICEHSKHNVPLNSCIVVDKCQHQRVSIVSRASYSVTHTRS